MKTLSSFQATSERYSSARYSVSHSLSTTPKTNYNGIHNYDSLKLRMTIDGFTSSNRKRLYSASKSSHHPSSVYHKRHSTPGVNSPPPSSVFVMNDSVSNRYSTLQYYPVQDHTTYSFFPSRHKYVKGKKKPIAVKVEKYVEEERMGRRIQEELREREQRKRVENEGKFEKIREKYLELSKSKRIGLKEREKVWDKEKPKTAAAGGANIRSKIIKNEGIIISPWQNEEEREGF